MFRTETFFLCNKFVKIFFAIIIRDLIASRYWLDGTNENATTNYVRFSVRHARVINITGNVPAWAAVYGVAIVEVKEVLRRVLLDISVLSFDTNVFDYLLTFTKRPQGSQAEAGFGTKHLEICMIFYLLHWTILA